MYIFMENNEYVITILCEEKIYGDRFTVDTGTFMGKLQAGQSTVIYCCFCVVDRC